MKDQKHNFGELAKLEVQIEKKLLESIQSMAEKCGCPLDEIVAMALKRYRVSHSDLENKNPDLD